MSGDKKSKRRRRDRDRADDNDRPVRGSGVDYSKVADRHIDDDRFENHRKGVLGPATADPGSLAAASGTPAAAAAPPKVSSQMTAVMRLMAGMEERTISEKLADSNRPTWEQYKKDNEDKLDIAGVDQKKMDAYRKELDEQRDRMLTRGTNHKKEGKGDRKSKKKKKRKNRRRDDSHSSGGDSSDDYSSDDGRKRKKHKKRSSKHDRKKSSRRYDSDSYDSEDDQKRSSKYKKKKDKKKKRGDDGSSSGDSYRLSTFFTKGSDDESK